jgi:hypothetical protein
MGATRPVCETRTIARFLVGRRPRRSIRTLTKAIMDMKENQEVSLPGPARPFARVPRISQATGRGPAEGEPRIAAFIWGGKIRPAPTLPYGRWKGAA